MKIWNKNIPTETKAKCNSFEAGMGFTYLVIAKGEGKREMPGKDRGESSSLVQKEAIQGCSQGTDLIFIVWNILATVWYLNYRLIILVGDVAVEMDT